VLFSLEILSLLVWRKYRPLSLYSFTFLIRCLDLLLIFLFLRILGKSLRFLGFTHFKRGIIYGGIGLFLLGLGIWGIREIPFFSRGRDFLRFSPSSPSLSFWKMLLITSTLPPFTEEVLFRGIFLEYLMERMNFLSSALLSSLLFALLHSPGYSFFPLIPFLGGLVFALLKEKSGSLWAPILFHSLGNALLLSFPYILSV